MKPLDGPAQLLAALARAQVEADHKHALIALVAQKGPKAIQAALETAAKAAKRRDSLAKKLELLQAQTRD